MIKIFISHSSNDKRMARRLTSDLVSLGFDVWLDEKNILVGKSIVESIQQGLEESNYVILLISPDSIKSNWVNKEWTSIVKKQIEKQKAKILPAIIKDVNLPIFLDDIKCANLKNNYARGLAALVKAVYENSNNFSDVKTFLTYDDFLKNQSLSELLDTPNQQVQFVGFTHNSTLFNYDDYHIIKWIDNSLMFEIFIAGPENSDNSEELIKKYKYYKKKFTYAELERVVYRCRNIMKKLKNPEKFKVYLLDLPRINLLGIKRIGDTLINRTIGFNQMGAISPTFVYNVNNPNCNFFTEYINNLRKFDEFYEILE